MRLSDFEIKTIHNECRNFFGSNSKVFLFGSRVDNDLRGGDIDLYIIPELNTRLEEKRSRFLLRLYEQIGEQKIDLIFRKDETRPIEQEAIQHGVLL